MVLAMIPVVPRVSGTVAAWRIWPRLVLALPALFPASAQQRAVQAFRRSLTDADIPRLKLMIENAGNWERKGLISELTFMHTPASAAELRKFVGDPNRVISLTALRSLARDGDKESVPLFIEKLTDPHLEFVKVAAWGLENAGDKAAVKHLVVRLRRQNAKDLLSDDELAIGSAIASLTGKKFSFTPTCRAFDGLPPWTHYVMGGDEDTNKYLEVTLKAYREQCKRYPSCRCELPSRDRVRLISWWDGGGFKAYAQTP